MVDVIKGRAGGDWIPAALHEGTHHWCFLTPLGQALALQQLRVRNLLLSSTSRDEQFQGARDALARFHAIDTLLRPLMEGLALLVELHGIIDYEDHVSRIQQWLLSITCHGFDDWEQPLAFSEKFLEQAFSADGLARRIELFSNPYDCQFGGYLPGYMAIRAAWQRAGSVSDELGMIGSFVSAVRFAVFYDSQLLELATSYVFSEPEDISSRTLARLMELLEPDALLNALQTIPMFWTEGQVYGYRDLQVAARCDEACEDERTPPRSLIYGKELTRAMKALGALLEQVELLESRRLDGAIEQKWNNNRWLLRRRELVWLASHQTNIRRDNQDVQVYSQDAWVTVGKLRRSITPKRDTFPGQVDLLLSLPDTWLVVMTSDSDTLLSTTSVVGRFYDELLLMVESLPKIEAAEQAIGKQVAACMPNELLDMVQALRRVTFTKADRWCAQMCLNSDSEDLLNAHIAALRNYGWAGVLEDDADAMKCLALISTAITMGATYEIDPVALIARNDISQDAMFRMEAAVAQLSADYLTSPPQRT